MPFLAGYDKRKPIRYGSVRPTANLMDFPLTVLIVDDADIEAELSGFANNIRVTLADGTTEVPFEVKNASLAGYTAQLYIKLTLSSSASEHDVVAYLYYDSAGTNGQDPTNVWDANYLLVHHMEEDLSAGNALDSTSNARHAVPTNFASGDLVNALIGKGNTFASGGGRTLVSPWGENELPANGTVTIVCKPGVAHNSGSIECLFDSPNMSAIGLYGQHYADNNLYFGMYSGSEHRVSVAASAGNWNNAVQQCYQLRFSNGGDTKLHRNGVQLGSTVTGTVVPSASTDLKLGHGAAGGSADTIIDEFRFSSVYRSDAYATFEQANLIANSTTVTLGPEETAGGMVEAVPAGEVTVTGNSPNTLKVAALAGQPVTITGNAPAAIKTATPESGIVTVTGVPPSSGPGVVDVPAGEVTVSAGSTAGLINNPVPAGTITVSAGTINTSKTAPLPQQGITVATPGLVEAAPDILPRRTLILNSRASETLVLELESEGS